MTLELIDALRKYIAHQPHAEFCRTENIYGHSAYGSNWPTKCFCGRDDLIVELAKVKSEMTPELEVDALLKNKDERAWKAQYLNDPDQEKA